MKKFFQQRKTLLIIVGCIAILVLEIILRPKFLDLVYSINDRQFHEHQYVPGLYEYYDVAREYMETSDEMKAKYGEDFTFYLKSMQYNKNHTKNEGEAEVSFWIKGHRHQTIFLEWQEDEWVIVDKPKKWRD